MRVKILNKNNSHPNAKNNGFFDVDDGAVFTECYNETLDTGTIVISNLEEPIKIEPYDIIAIYKTGENSLRKHMCVDTYTETMLSVNPKLYRYEISLFSETKQLEGVILPNLKITKVQGVVRTVSDYISQYMDEYGPKIRVSFNNTYHWSAKWSSGWYSTDPLHPDLVDKFNMECPEMQWNTPTLREVLNDLMMVADCIPVIKDEKLDYLDLTQINNKDWSEDNHINYVTRSKSSEDYVSELQVNLINVTDKAGSFVTKKEYIFFNIPDNNATMTTENIFVKTQYPIYRLKSLKMMVPTAAEGQPDEDHPNLPNQIRKWDQLDLMKIWDNGVYVNLVYEYQNWITKKIAYITNSPSNFREWQDYQNWTLYYTRGTNEIRNFNANQKFSPYMTSFLREILFYQIGVRNRPDGYSQYNVSAIGISSYYPTMFEVEYETLEGCLFRASKNDNVEHERVVIDNQTNSYVDSYSQGFLEYQKANRLGNEQLQINARFLPNETLINLADRYDESIIYQCQYQFYKNHTEVNALATKNYVLREYFTGVKSKIRSWAIVSGSEALIRHDLFKYYCEFSYEPHIEKIGLDNLDKYNISNYFVSPLYNYSSEPLQCVFVKTFDESDNPYPAGYQGLEAYYCLDLVNRVVGNSLVFTFKYLDNYWAGQSVHTENDFSDGTSPSRPNQDVYVKSSDIIYSSSYKVEVDSAALKNGGLPMIQHRYTDDKGEFESGTIIFSSKMKTIPAVSTQYGDVSYDDVVPGTNWTPDDNYSTLTNQSANFIYFCYQRPRVYEGQFRFVGTNIPSFDYSEIEFDFFLHKDSQEITNISTQFEFCSDTIDINISKYFVSMQKAVSDGDNLGLLYFASMYSKNTYDFRKPNELPAGQPEENFLVDISFDKNEDSNLSSVIYFKMDDGITYSNNTEAKNAAWNYVQQYTVYISQYIVDQFCLLSLNNIPEENCLGIDNKPSIKLNMNILKSRNKNIYDNDNHYLIVDEI